LKESAIKVNNSLKYFFSFPIVGIFYTNFLFGQNFLNGDFEINTAPVGSDQIFCTNSYFNSIVPNVYSFGTSTQGLDLITTGNLDGTAYSGNWYLGIEGGGIEQFSLKLNSQLDSGIMYRISFYDRGRSVHSPTQIEIGVSIVNNNFGTQIYAAPQAEYGVWNLRCFTFIAPFNAEFITIRGVGSTNTWLKLDNFKIDVDTLTPCIITSELIMPNVFTPNGDGINDIFSPVKFQNISNAYLKIFNRWGQVIYETENIQDGWDGEEYSQGVYFWQLSYTGTENNEKIEHGFVHLLR